MSAAQSRLGLRFSIDNNFVDDPTDAAATLLGMEFTGLSPTEKSILDALELMQVAF